MDLGEAAGWIFLFAILASLLELSPNTCAPAQAYDDNRLAHKKQWSQVGQCRSEIFVVALGFAWIEVLVAAAGSDECFEPVQDVRRFIP